jgi:DNA polymerase-3 subunit epsilon
MFAIIDIEATGGNPKKDRITEIAIFIHNGQKVVEQYCTLINPETYISPFISALTGITNEMVAEAPKWEEIAPVVTALTEGKVFVAHNVRFDYSFVSNEYKRLGLRFQRKNLCTVRLSRAILPGLTSYSLGRLCHHVGIPIEHRHRAFGDGAATAELFNVLLQHDTHRIIMDTLKDEINQSILPPNLRREVLDDIPEETGIYYFKDGRGRIIYIGKSTNIRQRVISHLSEDISSEKHLDMKNKITDISWELTGNELLALLIESKEIKRWMPEFNYAQRRKKFRYGLYPTYDAQGYLQLRAQMLKLEEEPLIGFGSKRGAESMLLSLAEKNGLCLQKCYLNPAGEPCLSYHEGNCNGACTGEESPEDYNRKVEEALTKFKYPQPNFSIVGEGRRPQERSIVCVENGRISGFGFFDEELDGNYGLHAVKPLLQPLPDHPDLHKIIRSFLKKNKKHHEVYYHDGISIRFTSIGM